MSDEFLRRFKTSGYALTKAKAPEKLDQIRQVLFEETRRLCPAAGSDIRTFMDRFHEVGLTGSNLNDFRVELIRTFNQKIDVGRFVFDAFEDALMGLVGPDVAVQKTCNLVIQQPGDIDVSPVHRDAPPNSLFEVVIWLPLVNCYGSKGMSMLDRQQTDEVVSELQAGNDAQITYSKAHKIGRSIELEYGSGCFFWTGLFHAIPVNAEKETRWSLNIRYKNVFSPYGEKGLPDFFRILRLSPLASLAIDRERHSLPKGE